MPNLDIIIVNWNAGQQLAECLRSIAKAANKDIEISMVIVVDNASSDASVEGLETIGLPLTIIRNRENRGFAVACNQGARLGKSDYILFLNPDTRLFADSLIEPITFMEQPSHIDVGIVGVELIDDRGQRSPSCLYFPSPAQIWAKMLGLDRWLPKVCKSYLMTKEELSNTRKVDMVIGAFLLIRRSAFFNIGGFDERFFLFWEDLDLCLSAKRAGYECYYLADVQAYHKGGGTTAPVKVASLFYSLRSRILYSYKHFSRRTASGILLGTLLIEPLTRTTLGIARWSGREIIEGWKAYKMLGRDLPAIYRTIRRQGDT